jgi:hypothetical protein
MSYQYHACKEKKEKIIVYPTPLHHWHQLWPKELVEMVQTSLQNNVRWHRKKSHRWLEQCPEKSNQTEHNKMSIRLY